MITKDLVAASSKALILSILSQKESYGYEIIKKVQELSNNEMKWKDGMLYPVLHRLEEKKLIESEWRITENGRQRKYYKLNKEGHKSLEIEKKQWLLVHSTLLRMWEVEPCLT